MIDVHSSHSSFSHSPSEQDLQPYYLKNFKIISDSIISDEYYDCLFTDSDRSVIEKFNTLSGMCHSSMLNLTCIQYGGEA